MKRIGNLFETIATRENFRLAFYKAATGKRNHLEVRAFANTLDEKIANCVQLLKADAFPIGNFHQFMIRDPKERLITAPCFVERVLHHAIMNLCEPILDRSLIDDTFACRKGKGREAALARSYRFAKGHEFVLKLDVRKYFDCIRHDRMLSLLRQRFKDRPLLRLFEQIIEGYRGSSGIGMPIGSLTSQHFANFYLASLDRFIKETLRVRGYVRYMDDMILWSDSKDELMTHYIRCSEFLSQKLSLECKPSRVMRSDLGLSFLGCRVFPTHLELNRQSKQQIRKSFRNLRNAERIGMISQLTAQARNTSLFAYARAGKVQSWRFRQKLVSSGSVGDP